MIKEYSPSGYELSDEQVSLIDTATKNLSASISNVNVFMHHAHFMGVVTPGNFEDVDVGLQHLEERHLTEKSICQII